jgi:hypothetical protein
MALRDLDTTLRASLLNKEAFVYAHLIKFEKPIKSTAADFSKEAKNYAYITDASMDMVWDDGSTTVAGVSNGDQIYRANKVKNIGDIKETTDAKASTINLSLSAVPLNTSVIVNITTTSSTIIADADLVAAGFTEGDKILITGSTNANNGEYFRIESFSNDNKTITVANLDTTLGSDNQSKAATLEFASEEIESIFTSKTAGTYANYINREVFIYKAHINIETGAIIGAPYLLFKGIIATSKVTEDPEKESTISWGLTSHWGDFQTINGRITSDSEHRGLRNDGTTDTAALKDPAYADDLGFLHSEQALNIMAVYQVKETRYRIKKKKGWVRSKTKIRKYEVEVDRDVDLRFNLDAKSLPVVYGVRKIDSFPIFVDTDKNDASVIYAAYALCEGEIGGLYDIYFDDEPSICADKPDFDVRALAGDNYDGDNPPEVFCRGRMDRGDVLTGINSTSSTVNTTAMGFMNPQYWDESMAEAYYGYASIAITFMGQTIYVANPLLTGAGTDSGTSISAGITHEKAHVIETPVDTKLIFHSGKPGQRADDLLCGVAAAGNFKIQNDYFDNPAEYWGSNHRLLDTAYVVAKYTISDGEIELPSMDFVVRGKVIPCYNYDFAYELDSLQTQGTAPKIGDSVSVKNTSGNATIDASNTIADIYTFPDADGNTKTLVRLQSDPGLGDVTAFYLTDYNSTHKYYLKTYDRELSSGTIGHTLEEEITSSTSSSGSGMTINWTDNGYFAEAIGTSSSAGKSSLVSFYKDNATTSAKNASLRASYPITRTSSKLQITNVGTEQTSSFPFDWIISKDAIRLPNNTNEDGYVGSNIILTYTASDSSVYVQTRKIIAWDDTNDIALVDHVWDAEYMPRAGGSFKYSIKERGDLRVSINPAIQLLDYMRSKKYGRGLDIDDIDLSSFLASARLCDTRSMVTIQVPSGTTIAADDIIKYPVSGDVLFQGKVSNVQTLNSLKEVTLTDCIGKLANRWYEWKTYAVNELVWDNGKVGVVSSAGTVAKPTAVSAVIVKNVSENDPITLFALDSTPTTSFEGDPVVKKYNSIFGSYGSGYSLYDSDDVKYWKYLGWDSQNQRHVTRHQTNTIVDTTLSVFENVNKMLSQFNGLLRYTNGKYNLDIKSSANVFETVTVDSVDHTPRSFDQDDIIGAINVQDSGIKGSFNSVSVEIDDPQNKFEDRSVTFFNSDYLKEDRNIPRKGDIGNPYITNYFNARFNAKQYLEESRYSLDINFTLGPEAALLIPGELIKLTYPRFGWSNKYFRISNLTLKKDCLVSVSAEEHNDAAYEINGLDKPIQVQSDASRGIGALPTAPTSLTAATDAVGGITLNWTNSATYNPETYKIEILRADSQDFSSNPVIIDTVSLGAASGNATYVDQMVSSTLVTKYYKIRYVVSRGKNIFKYSAYTSVVTGSAKGGADGLPGLPGASAEIVYNSIQSGETTATAGQYNLWKQDYIDGVAQAASYSRVTTWEGITAVGAADDIDYIRMNTKGSETGAPDRRTFFNTLQINDTITFYMSAGQWVDYRILEVSSSSQGLLTTDTWQFAVKLVESRETDGTGNPSGDVDFRFSRSFPEEPPYVNYVPSAPAGNYGSMESLTVDNISTNAHTSKALDTATNYKYNGAHSIKMTSTGEEFERHIYFTTAPWDTRNLSLPANRRWLVTAWIRGEIATNAKIFMCLHHGENVILKGTVITNLVDDSSFNRYGWVLDATSNTHNTQTEFTLGFGAEISGGYGDAGSGDDLWIDGITIFDVTGLSAFDANWLPLTEFIPVANAGGTGGDGLSVAELTVYRRDDETPGIDPDGSQFNFGTQALTPPGSSNDNWYIDIAAANTAGNTDHTLWVSTSLASIVGVTGIDSDLTWSTPTKALEDGSDGSSVDIIFTRAASQPGTPSPSASAVDPWKTNVASATGTAILWSSVGTKADGATNFTWQTPIQVEGDPGLPAQIEGIQWMPGSWNIELTRNTDHTGQHWASGIKLSTGTYTLPGGLGTRTITSDNVIYHRFLTTHIPSDYESSDNWFYVIWGDVTMTAAPGSSDKNGADGGGNSASRFTSGTPSTDMSWGGQAHLLGMFVAVYNKNSKQWFAVDAGGDTQAFFPNPDKDIVIAAGFKSNTHSTITAEVASDSTAEIITLTAANSNIKVGMNVDNDTNTFTARPGVIAVSGTSITLDRDVEAYDGDSLTFRSGIDSLTTGIALDTTDQIVTASKDQLIKFNKDGDNFAPRRLSEYAYNYDGGPASNYLAGGVSSAANVGGDTWLESYVQFFVGSTLSAELKFIHIVNYGLDDSSADYVTNGAMTIWESFTEKNSSGMVAGDFTVTAGFEANGTTPREITRVRASATSLVNDGTIVEYGPDQGTYDPSYSLKIVHDPSGTISSHSVQVETIGDTAPIK